MSKRQCLYESDEPEPTMEDSGIDEDSNESSTASLWLSILNFEKENGRTYYAFNRGKYLYPNDEILEGRLALCPANASSTRVLDAGTGTGVWAIDYDDLEHTWIWTKPFDFIFARGMIGSFREP
ncbi:uncharacterized protein VDAG_05224 [Verticillium dahliae VdLs.17]|uniref:Methyltransferase n=1 Tax=Verticillium dahliae (strain VdLs.17 / ATCC MYA-4575 / FGSC 10137) TaxID=498257 RepID=G2X4Z2_VERDV|nr:uncharacterized protein VDAG_05224 [Verticillium dahliae VdLs.17]EGY23786.1 hypothetical protein VDAG_05224 [Verticillium dahliae VdLs.17]